METLTLIIRGFSFMATLLEAPLLDSACRQAFSQKHRAKHRRSLQLRPALACTQNARAVLGKTPQVMLVTARLPRLPRLQAAVPGLHAEVHVLSSSPSGFISETSSQPTFAFLDPQINHPSTGNAWIDQLPRDYFAIRWAATLTIQQAGEYEFFLESDDGSRLVLDGSEVVLNGGFHGMEEKSGKVNLTAGGWDWDWDSRRALKRLGL